MANFYTRVKIRGGSLKGVAEAYLSAGWRTYYGTFGAEYVQETDRVRGAVLAEAEGLPTEVRRVAAKLLLAVTDAYRWQQIAR